MNLPLIRNYGIIKFLHKLKQTAEAENLDKILELLQEGNEAALFEFHTAVWEAKRRGVTVMAFRKKLKPKRKGSAELADAILSDGTYIQATLAELPDADRAERWKRLIGGPRIRRAKEQGATRIKFFFREGAQIHDSVFSYLNEASGKFGIAVEYEKIPFP